MKIVFLCSSLDPGRDGAGDQARSLAGFLVTKGIVASAVSINEVALHEITEEHQDVEGIEIPVLRIPAQFSPSKKYKLLSGWINRYSADWISLQYVGFGFQKYGLPWHLPVYLRSSIGKAKLNIMFQELWCGTSFDSTKKEKLLGAFQKNFIKLMLQRLNPDKVFTNTAYYAADLKKLNITAALAPVFGNIPLSLKATDNEWSELQKSCNLLPLTERKKEWLTIGFFGTIYPCVGIETLLQYATVAANNLKLKLGVVIIGNGRGTNISLIKSNTPGSTIWQTGQISPSLINKVMQYIDIGIITTPVRVLNKSSTTSAWLERGIPVAVPGDDKEYIKNTMEEMGVFQISEAFDVQKCITAKGKFKPKNRFAEVAMAYGLLEKN